MTKWELIQNYLFKADKGIRCIQNVYGEYHLETLCGEIILWHSYIPNNIFPDLDYILQIILNMAYSFVCLK